MSVRSGRSSNILRSKTKLSRMLKSKQSWNVIYEDDFNFHFIQFCSNYNMQSFPRIKPVDEEPIYDNFDLPRSPSKIREGSQIMDKGFLKMDAYDVLAVYDDAQTKTNLNKVIVKNYVVNDSFLQALREVLIVFNTITCLKLEFCKLTHEQLRILKKALKAETSVTELSINGNPNKYQSFNIILKNTKLEYVSMKLCKINDRGMRKIAKVLYSYEHPLVYLNLSSNFISDEGAQDIGNMLRANRTLQGLNLADNWITDEGCRLIMASLKRFPLTHDEIVFRRKRIYDRLFTKRELMRRGLDSSSLSLDTINSKSKKTMKGSVECKSKSRKGSGSLSKRTKSRSKDRQTGSTGSKKSVSTQGSKTIEEEIEKILGKDNHPFVADSFPCDSDIFCKGNVNLVHLNLSYNKLTSCGLQEIVNTLIYQDTVILNKDEGLTSIGLEGYPQREKLMEIIEIIYYKIHKSFSSSSRILKSVSAIRKAQTPSSRKTI